VLSLHSPPRERTPARTRISSLIRSVHTASVASFEAPVPMRCWSAALNVHCSPGSSRAETSANSGAASGLSCSGCHATYVRPANRAASPVDRPDIVPRERVMRVAAASSAMT
jgi:hypothetical protein